MRRAEWVCATSATAAPGLRRLRPRGKNGFRDVDARGAQIRHAATLARLRMLAIPPAWTDVWICPAERGHIQATGRDARGRKQYRYHAVWTRARDAAKHARICAFAAGSTRVRSCCRQLLAQPGLTREKVLPR